MRAKIFQVDAFTTRVFGGNPAAVIPMDRFPADPVMQTIAAENNLSETAFIVRERGDYLLRWFTPVIEVPLCGHATLASAAVVMERMEPGRKHVLFDSKSGPLHVSRTDAGYVLNFPSRPSERVPVPDGFADSLGLAPEEVYLNAFNYMAVLKCAEDVRRLAPDLGAIARMNRPGVIVTAPGDDGYDCVSRYFAPAKGIPEDPVTGAAHCMLAPYWARRLGKLELRAYQASARGGEMMCRPVGDRIELEGQCVFYMEGEVEV